MRSILDLDINELEEVLNTNTLPEDVGLEGIESRKDFEKLFKHRLQPKYMAQALLKDKLKTRITAETPEIKSERLAIKQAELELRKMKMNAQTQMQGNIYKRLQALEAIGNLTVAGITSINQKLDELLSQTKA